VVDRATQLVAYQYTTNAGHYATNV